MSAFSGSNGTVLAMLGAVVIFERVVPVWVLVVAGLVLFMWLARKSQHYNSGTGGKTRNMQGFAAVAGCEEAVEDLRELVLFLTDPKRFEKFGAMIPRGALLVGPPGTGKTLLARSVAAEAGVHFIAANGSDFVESFVGVGAKRIRELYKDARSHSRAIVFIDEIDAIARRRSDTATSIGGLVEHENTLIALLHELDGFAASNVITIAATNRPDVLDPALLRPGRLDRRIEVPSPDRVGRVNILQIHTANKPLASDLDLEYVAERTPGMTGADLARICNEAALTAVRLSKDVLDLECFDAAIELVALGRERTSRASTVRDRRITAWHEAGHAVCALMRPDVLDPVAVTIVPRGNAGGVTWLGLSEDSFITRDEVYSRLVVTFGGRVAEEILLSGSCTQGAANDLVHATEIATSMAMHLGMTPRGFAVRGGDDDSSRAAIDSLLSTAHIDAHQLLTANAALLEAVASALLVSGRLNRVELVALRDSFGVTPSVRPVPVPVIRVSPPPSSRRPTAKTRVYSPPRPRRSLLRKSFVLLRLVFRRVRRPI